MKPILFFLLVLSLTSCEPYRYYAQSQYSTTQVQDPTKLTNLPIYLHENEVEVFFSNEKPSEPYIKAFLLEEVAYGEVSYAQLVKNLQAQAYEKGADAIILLSRNRSVSESEVSYTITNTASALGIKYVKNMPFMEDIGKRVVLSVFDTTEAIYKVQEEIRTTPEGLPISKNNRSLYHNNFYIYSLDYMLYEKNQNWIFVLDEKNRIKKRLYGNYSHTYKFTYDNQNKVSSILKDTEMYDFEFKFFYKNGLLVRKEIYRKAQPYSKTQYHMRTEVFEYNTEGALLRRIIYKIAPNGEPFPYMKLAYEFLTEEEYQVLLDKETVE